ncbi:hypothetical protein KEM55_003308 [Ascosphaera atra]|nr:hypothetical protein KEM55_003308 [Ascosphaera atra]
MSQGPELEVSRREREVLDAICQRTSDSVVDIWAVNPQPLPPPPMHEATTPAMFESPLYDQQSATHPYHPQQISRPQSERTVSTRDAGEFGGMKFTMLRHASSGNLSKTAKQHWGEVVTSTGRRKPKKRLGLEAIHDPPTEGDDTEGTGEENDVFRELVVK